MSIFTFHNPIVSAAQAALHHALVRQGHPDTASLSAGHEKMQQLVKLGRGFTGPRSPAPGADTTEEVADECLKLYLDYVAARFAGHEQKAQQLYDELKFSVCDPLWLEAITAYEDFVHCEGGRVSYTGLQPGEDVGPFPVDASPLRIALLADWGTGDDLAKNVLAQAKALAPHLLIHMGDVYYAGTQAEQQAYFLDVVEQYFPGTRSGRFPVYVIPGNHDYYSGGTGFTWLIGQLGRQKGSYFCLRGEGWQVVALDTGYNDRDPFTVESNITALTDDQVAWLADVMGSAGGRRTILLTHHQLYSGAGPVGEQDQGGQTVRWGINPLLYEQVRPYFGQIPVWLWGHEHNSVVFQPRQGVPPGRCIGSAAVPMMVIQDPYRQDATLQGVDGIDVPQMDPSHELGNNGVEYYHGFAMLTLDAQQATVTYYQVPPGGAYQEMLSETYPAAG
ncbi:MAG TPA: metallophosphoesterase [Longimicrobium sp.]|jgi:hypothetical protein